MSEPVLVCGTDTMPPHIFKAHLALRHNQRGELGGLSELSELGATRDRKVWEAYHERLHDIEEYEHEH